MRVRRATVPLNSVAAHVQRSFEAVRTAVLVMLIGNLLATLIVVTVFQPQARNTTLAARAARLADIGMLDQETGLRGFLLTGDVTFLEPYALGQTELATADTELLTLSLSSPEIADLV